MIENGRGLTKSGCGRKIFLRALRTQYSNNPPSLNPKSTAVESVHSISRDGPDIPICETHCKKVNAKITHPKQKFKAIKLLYLYYSVDFLPTNS